MKSKSNLLLAGFLCVAACASAAADDARSVVGKHQNDPGEKAAIGHLLNVYTTSVSTGNEAAFESILLNDHIPFSSTAQLQLAAADAKHLDTSRYGGFKEGIFRTGKHYAQQFYHVHIEQDGELAQVSLDFVTKDTQTRQGGYGWKSLTLLKVHGQWKIASEFYTVYPLPG